MKLIKKFIKKKLSASRFFLFLNKLTNKSNAILRKHQPIDIKSNGGNEVGEQNNIVRNLEQETLSFLYQKEK